MSGLECCSGTPVAGVRPRAWSEDLHRRQGTIQDIIVVQDLRVVSRRTFLDLELCDFVETADSCAPHQKWSDIASECDTASDVAFEDLSSEDETSCGESFSESPVFAPACPPGVFAVPVGFPSGPCLQPRAESQRRVPHAAGPPGVSGLISPAQAQKQETRTTLVQKKETRTKLAQKKETRTTLVLKNIAKGCTGATLAERLSMEGFAGLYDFVYVPLDLQRGDCFGYAFVNMVSADDAVALRSNLCGLADWAQNKDLEAQWSEQQSLALQVEKYRNSPLMHESVRAEARPLLFEHGVNVAFPEPTKTVKKPRTVRGSKQSA